MEFLLSDFDSHSESSSSEDQDDLESLYGGQASNIFSSLEATIENIDDFLLFEPQFLYGDIVSIVSDTSGKTGKVINVDMNVDLENIYGSKIHNINSKHLKKIRSFAVGDFVVCGAWLGKVEKIVDSLTILFDGGRKSQLSTTGQEKIIAISPDLVEDPRYPFYPGQRVQVESSVSYSTHWLCGNRRGKRNLGTVCNIDAGLIYVDWLDCVGINDEKQPAPPHLQDSKNVSLLSCLPHANWQLGDWCVLPNEQSLQEHKQSFVQEIAVIVKTKTKVDVQWQDGSLSEGLDSHLLSPVNIIDIHDFWPGTIVMEKGTAEHSQSPDSQAFGIVRCADSKERTVKVKWCNPGMSELLDDEKQTEEILSAYELIEHPDYSYSFGDAVFRKDDCTGVDFADSSCLENKIFSKNCMEEEGDVQNGRDGTEYFLNKYLSRIGIVIGLKNGFVEVKWASSASSKVAPFEIYRADKCEGTSTSSDTFDNVQHSNDVIQAKDSQLLEQKVKDVPGLDYVNSRESTSQFLPQAAIELFTSITSNLFQSVSSALVGAYCSKSEEEQCLGKPADEKALELCSLHSGGQLNDSEMFEAVTSKKSEEINKDISFPSCSKHPEHFKQFDMVSGCSDHHFVNGSGAGLQSFQMKRGWLKKVHQEWSILKENLPDTVYLRAYEDRMDLLRAAIVGSAGTPYHDGLFFFDIYLTPQYPNDPPMVYYHSGGLRINPNLYESGKICLSLLNTWTGSNTEVWNPGSSTILQVLLSLQALVLNEKPYFNEAGYESQIGKAEGEKNSANYNENTFIVNCRSMLYQLHNPPKHFEGLVKEHFNRRSSNILLACKAYMEGAPIGYPFIDTETCQEENRTGNSIGFKIMLGKLLPRLVEAFSALQANCSKMLDQVS